VRKFWIPSLAVLVSASIWAACSGSLRHNLDPGEFFVEGWIEYVGATERWAGPLPLKMHIVARDDDKAQIKITPEAMDDLQANRMPTSTPEDPDGPPDESSGPDEMSEDKSEKPAVMLDAVAIRERLTGLARVAHKSRGRNMGCMWPVKLKLIGASDTVIQRTGCRGDERWVQDMNSATAVFLKMKYKR